MTYGLKPIGTQEENAHIDANQGYRYEVHFQKDKRPASVKVGDILILYAVGHKCLMGYCEVISRVFESAPAEQMAEPWRERFPYGVYAENRSKSFSENWHDLRLSPQHLGKAFHESTGLPLTRPGTEHLGAIEWGKSYFALADDFARHLIETMDMTSNLK